MMCPELFVDKIAELQAAYIAAPQPDFPAELNTQKEALDLGDISALIGDVILPELLDDDVLVEWSTSNESVIDPFGGVTRPENLDANVTLTATLTKNGFKVTKEFTATVLATSGFTSSLLLKYDFSDADTVAGTVTDMAEKHYVGTLENGAEIETIGAAGNQFDVLYLNTDSSYFDMGSEVGELVYGLSDYSVSIYFMIDTMYSNLSSVGNFLYTFSNGDSSAVQKNGYIYGRATNLRHAVATKYWEEGQQAIGYNAEPEKGVWHNFVYTQNGTVGTIYFDGDTLGDRGE